MIMAVHKIPHIPCPILLTQLDFQLSLAATSGQCTWPPFFIRPSKTWEICILCMNSSTSSISPHCCLPPFSQCPF
uniref:Uncharacterized protein n=1 Tax=Arundo donax TaxID=35708 RepID=A0A0A8YNT2_ARUDO